MKWCTAASLLLALAGPCWAGKASPIEKVLQLITNLEVKVQGDAAESKKVYDEFVAFCEDRAAHLNFDITTGESDVASLQATIDQETALIASLTTKVEELSASISKNDADLKEATAIRAREEADFTATEKDLTETIDMLRRAIRVLEREAQKGGAALAQLQRASSLSEALGVVVRASGLNAQDAKRLTALVQRAGDADSDSSMGAPEVAAYENQSGSVVKTLKDLLDQANTQLDSARKQETTNRHNFEMLKLGLEDEIKYASKELEEAKQGIAASSERKSAAEGDHAATSKALEDDKAALEDLHQDCLAKAENFEAETKSREEELKALADAKRVLQETTSGAHQITYGLNQVSFLQVRRSGLSSGAGLAGFEAVRLVRDLARKQHNPALAQLAANMAAATSVAAGQDPFAKVKGLITDMIARLEEEAGADASHKAYCDEELAEAEAKHGKRTNKVEKLTTQIDQMTARSAQLKEEVAALQNALAALASAQAEMDKVRQQEHELYVSQKADMEQGITGVQAALKTLRDYYGQQEHAHAASEGAATGIIGLLEVVESDLTKGLAGIVATEQSSLRSYQQETRENEVEKASKEQDVKYKSKEAASLDKEVADAISDRSNVQTELDAVTEYLAKLHEQCDAKAEPYEERVQRREAEIAGLKQALEVLEGEAVLLQKSAARRSLRGHA